LLCRFHSLHHTQFRTNYSLFMPLYDYVYSTMDKSSDQLYESSLRGAEETPALVHLTHMTDLQSVYHLRIGFASVASRPSATGSMWYMWVLWPVAWLSMALAWAYGSSAFVVERIKLGKLRMQTWAVPRYNFQVYMTNTFSTSTCMVWLFLCMRPELTVLAPPLLLLSMQYGLSWERESINGLIERAILDADARGVKVLSLGLLNQAKQLNGGGELFRHRYPKLRVRLVDGSGLATAVVLRSIPRDAKQVLLHAGPSKIACATAAALCERGVQVCLFCCIYSICLVVFTVSFH
jgi:aldehyde decarbonylase